MKRILSLVLTAVLLLGLIPVGAVELSLPVKAADTPVEHVSGYYTYTVTDGNATITKMDPAAGATVTVPTKLGGYPVTTIRYSAFSENTTLVSLTLPEGVTEIGQSAFSGCSALKTITFPESLAIVAAYAFTSCSALEAVYTPNLKAWCRIRFEGYVANPLCYATKLYANGKLIKGSLVVPSDITEIYRYAFAGYDAITSVTLHKNMTRLDEHAFYECSSLTTVNYNIVKADSACYSSPFTYCNNLTKVTFGSGVQEIPDCLLESSKITSITLPNSLRTIGSNAFSYCYNLTSVTIPKNVTEIGRCAFQYCRALKTVVFQGSVSTLTDSVFENCSALTSVTFPKNLEEISFSAFKNCTALKSVTIPEGVKIVGGFYGCTALSSVTLPNSVTEIEGEAFSGCKALKSINLPNQLRSIGDDAFNECTSLSAVTLPSGLKTLGSGAFRHCEKITSVVIPNGVTVIRDNAFSHCLSLETVTLPRTLTAIEADAFEVCRELRSIDIPDGVTSLGYRCFGLCSSLTEFTIPNSVKTVGDDVFMDCTSLKSITFGSSVEYIGSWAFENCRSLTDIHITDLASWCSIDFMDSPWQYADNIFLNGELIEGELVVPKGVKSVGRYAFSGYPHITSVIFSEGVEEIYSAFAGCPITAVYLPKSLKTVWASAFSGCTALTDVWYSANIADRNNITVYTKNDPLLNAEWHYLDDCETAGHAYSNQNDNICNVCGEDKTLPYYTYTVTDGKATITNVKVAITGDVVIPETLGGAPVTAIAKDAFRDCVNVTSVTIPATVSSIGSQAFKGCAAMQTVYYNAVDATVTSSAAYPLFGGCVLLDTLYVGEGVARIPAHAFRSLAALKTVHLPRSLTTIEKNAFYQDSAIVAVRYGGTTSERKLISIASYNTELTKAKWLYTACEHAYDNACDKTCNVCGKERQPARHVWGKEVVLEEATDTRNGSKQYTCSVCGSTAVVETTLGKIKNGVYYYDGEKTANAGLVMVDGAYYYVAAGGQVKTGRYAISNVNGTDVERGIYYFFEDGTMNTEEGVYDGFYYNERGKSEAYAGLVEWSGSKYYVSDSGRVKTGRYFISKLNGIVPKKRAYTFYNDGSMLEETRIYEADGYYYEDGIRIPYAGLVEYEGHFYYVADNGAYVTSKRQNVSNTSYTEKSKGYYYFDENGHMLMNVIMDGRYYGKDGLAPYNAGVVKVGRYYYYVGGTHGLLKVNQTFSISTAKANGLLTAGKYTADANGRLTAA